LFEAFERIIQPPVGLSLIVSLQLASESATTHPV
jgi:hypothetical protein